jgi:hypothetical protein
LDNIRLVWNRLGSMCMQSSKESFLAMRWSILNLFHTGKWFYLHSFYLSMTCRHHWAGTKQVRKWAFVVSQNKFIGNEMVQYWPVYASPLMQPPLLLLQHDLWASLGWYETGRYCTILLPTNLFWLTAYAYVPNLFHSVWPCMAKLYLPFKSNKTGHVI